MKGFNKLTVQILTLATIMFCMSFIPEIEEVKNLLFRDNGAVNFRGGVYYATGFVLFCIAVIRLIMTHDEKDFIN